MAHLLFVYFIICFSGFCLYHLMNLVLWFFGGIEESEDEE